VCNAGGAALDLIMTTLSDYEGAYSRNKVVGAIYQLSVRNSAKFAFQLVQAGTTDPHKVTRVVFSVRNIDFFNGIPVWIFAPGYMKVAKGKGVEERVAERGPDTFQSVRNVPAKDQIVSLMYHEVSRWEVTFGVGNFGENRHWNFELTSGTDLMPSETSCTEPTPA